MAQPARKSLAMGPSVRNLLSHYQLDAAQITSTGPHQTLLKGDVIDHISRHNLQPSQSPSHHLLTSQQSAKPKMFSPNLDISGYQPKPGPEGFSRIAKELLEL